MHFIWGEICSGFIEKEANVILKTGNLSSGSQRNPGLSREVYYIFICCFILWIANIAFSFSLQHQKHQILLLSLQDAF